MNEVRQAQHTPPPWYWQEFGVRGGDGPSAFRIEAGTGTIADTYAYSALDEANARLIAAAPRMADALVKLIRLANGIGHEYDAEVIEAREVMAEAYGVAACRIFGCKAEDGEVVSGTEGEFSYETVSLVDDARTDYTASRRVIRLRCQRCRRPMGMCFEFSGLTIPGQSSLSFAATVSLGKPDEAQS